MQKNPGTFEFSFQENVEYVLSSKHLKIKDMKTFFSHIGYIRKMKKNSHISQFQYPVLENHNKMKFN